MTYTTLMDLTRRSLCTLVAIGGLLCGSVAFGQSAEDAHRDRLIANWAANNNWGLDVCRAWDSLHWTAKYNFIWHSDVLYKTGLLQDITKLYSIAGANAGCGGSENNRTFWSMTADLRDRLTGAVAGQNTLPYWGNTQDFACSYLGGLVPIFPCPHPPFWLQSETVNRDYPTGQIQFFPNLVAIRRQYQPWPGYAPELCVPVYGFVKPNEVCNGQCDHGPGATGPAPPNDLNNHYCTITYHDTVTNTPDMPYTRQAVGYQITDGLSFEIDLDFAGHESAPWSGCGNNAPATYTAKYGDPNFAWVPSQCQPPSPSAYQGCYIDQWQRELPYFFGQGHTVESCINLARQNGYAFAGLQSHGECWAGNEISLGDRVNDSQCNMPCSANEQEICGSDWRNSVWSTGNGGTVHPALMTADSAVRTCSGWSWWDPVYQPTAEACGSYCQANGANACEWYQDGSCFVEFGGGCTVQGGFGGWWAAVFNNGGGGGSGGGGGTGSGNQYVGCFTDDENRALPVFLGDGHTVESCVDAARQNGLPYAGVQWFGECWGGWSPGYSEVSGGECNTPCNANPNQMCGGGWRNSIYVSN